MRILTILMLAACSNSGIIDCNPGLYLDPACTNQERCDATTKKCEPVKSCTQDSQCSGYVCSVSNVCERNCHGQSNIDDSFCTTGYTCNTSNACVKGTACTDDTPCGAYACNTTNSACRVACTGNTQCAMGKTCDTASHTCK
jgi:hypothetical protein